MTLRIKDDFASYRFVDTDFQSVLYWVPVLQEEEGSQVLINLNPDDKHYKKIAFHYSDGSDSYHHIVYDNHITLDVIVKRLKDITDRGTYEYTTTTAVEEQDPLYGIQEYKLITTTEQVGSKCSSTPIQILMREMNFIS